MHGRRSLWLATGLAAAVSVQPYETGTVQPYITGTVQPHETGTVEIGCNLQASPERDSPALSAVLQLDI